MDTNISGITVMDAGKWVVGGFAQNGVLWAISLALGVACSACLYWALWVFDKHNAMNPQKKKHFFVGVSLVATLLIGAVMIFCSMMTAETGHLNQQIGDMRQAAVGRDNLGLHAQILFACPTVIPVPTEQSLVKNQNLLYTSKVQGMSSGPTTAKILNGVDMIFVLRISNAGPPTTAWGFKAYIVPPDGKEMDAIIPTLTFPKTGDPTPLLTATGGYRCGPENYLLDTLSFDRMETGDANNFWVEIHINGITQIESGTLVVITFQDVFGRTVTIQDKFVPGA